MERRSRRGKGLLAIRTVGYLRVIRERLHPLNRLRRFAPCRTILGACDVALWARVPGVRWNVRARALRHASALILNGGVEPAIYSLFFVFTQRVLIESFWDIGANFGYYSWIVKSLSPAVDVRMFEPDADNLGLIRETASRARLAGITIREVAVSERSGLKPFIRDEISGSTGGIAGDEGTFSERQWGIIGDAKLVDTVSIDEERIDAGHIDLIKIDVEGHEEAVFRGARETLRNDEPILIFECFHGGTEIIDFLSALGYWVGDAETMRDDQGSATNFLALPPRHRHLLEPLREDWSVVMARLGERRIVW